MDRRGFLKQAGALAVAAPCSGLPVAKPSTPRVQTTLPFTPGFVWGTATAAFQVEGAVNEDGRGKSIWDTFSHVPGNIHNNDTADRADDHYHLYKEDVALMKALGLKAYRFSIAWPRILPDGTGVPNPKGFDFYDRLLDELIGAGIEPCCTLFHWDLPQRLQDRGGWSNQDTSKAFADYAGFVAQKLSDRISFWMTTNELATCIDSGYGPGRKKPPQADLPAREFAQTKHNAVLGHGLAVRAIRAFARRPPMVGIAENVAGTMPAVEEPQHIEAAKRALRELNAPYATVMLEGKYPNSYLNALGQNAPKFTAEELGIISSPLDFFGINIYTTQQVIAADNGRGYTVLPRPSSYPRLPAPWLYFAPEAMYWTPKLMADLWKTNALYITENGCASDDVPVNGSVFDTDRVMFLRMYLTQLQRAVAEGVPVKGYFLWSLLDNFEWNEGYSRRFGITYVDFETLKRTPKLSSEFYRNVVARNAL